MKKLFSLVLITLVALGYTKAQVDTVYKQNFSGGIPAGWANFGTSNGSPNTWVKWRFTTAGCHDAYDNGAKITSPTAANGFLLFDSDSLDNGAQAGNFGNGPAPAPQVVTLTTTAINIASTPYVRLQFYQYFRNLQSNTVLGISTDSSNWFFDTLNTSITVNVNTPSNDKQIIDLSPYIAQGANTGKLYLSWIMDPAYYYFWQIDDILITSLPDYDLTAKQAFGSKGTTGLFYGSIPVSQFTSTDSFQAFATYGNTGSVTQSNINTNFNLLKGTALVDSALADPVVASLPYGVDTTVTPARQFGTNGIAKYTVAVDVRSSDSANFDAGTNRDSLYFSVTDSVFSNSTSLAVGSSAYYLLEQNQGVSFTLGNLYEVTQTDTVTSVTTALLGGTGNTSPGSIVQASIYAVTAGNTLSYSSNQPVVSTYNKTLTSGNITAINAANVVPVTLPINFQTGNAVLAPGLYWVGVSASYTPDSNVILATTLKTQTGCLAGAPDPSVQNTLQAFNVGVPYVNMNFGHASSLLWANWSRNPSTSPVKAGQNVTFTGSSNASVNATYTWTFYSDSDAYYESYDTGKVVTTSFPQSSTSFTGKDVINACVTVHDGGNSVTYCNTVNVRPLGVGINETTLLNDVSLAPNPTNGKVNVTVDGISGPVSIIVENLLGEVVKTFEGEANGSFNKTYDLSALSNGIYLVKVTNGGAAATKKLSISK